MNIFYTLFGGLLLVIVLFGVLGLIKTLPNVMRALLASVAPLFAYVLHIFDSWPGLDVVAIHISLFLGAGLMLYMFSQSRRRARGQLHWGPKLLIGFFVMLAVLNACFLAISTNGLPRIVARWWLPHGDTVNSGFSGVVAHDQQAASAVSAELSRRYSAKQLGWRIEVNGLDYPAQTQQNIKLKVYDRTGLPLSGLHGELRLSRPGAPEPVARIAFVPTDEGEYHAELDLPEPGRWLVELVLQQDGAVRYRDSQEIVLP
jgi:nitrogen fixation protein FixH